jgi:hypothetical protein
MGACLSDRTGKRRFGSTYCSGEPSSGRHGKLVSAERIEVAKPAPGKFVARVEVWVSVEPD